jgi:hypothetical protein
MKTKVSELKGKALDRMVDKALGKDSEPYCPAYSSDWAFAGPVIERERIAIHWSTLATPQWMATGRNYIQTGETALVAAMRCVVAERFGESVLDN